MGDAGTGAASHQAADEERLAAPWGVINAGWADGDLGWIRTSDQQLRRLLLYPLSYEAVARV